MAIIELCELKARMKFGQRLLGFDHGSKTIGLALSDTLLMIATPMETIKKTKFSKDTERVLAIIKEQDVGGLVLGFPLSMDGTEGPRAQSVRQYAANLSTKTDLPICLWDERLSTTAVERVLEGEADLSRKRRKELVDKAAASYILQGALDALSRM